MMLDVQSLLVATMASLLALSIAMPLIMGWRVSRGARYAQMTVMAQTVAWGCLLASSYGWDRLLSTSAMACMSLGLVAMWLALHAWLGPRPGRGAMGLLAVVMPLGYGLGFSSYAFRVGWANFLLAAQMAVICLALAWPAPNASRRWRTLIGVCFLALGMVTVWRGVLGAFYTEAYPYFRAPHPVNVASALINSVTVVLSTLGLLVAWREESERELRAMAQPDGLTGLLNRRAFNERAAQAIGAARRYQHPLCVLLLDLDHFKEVNDQHGHETGDQALQLVASTLQGELRSGDLACRHGGEEFCVLLSHAGLEGAGAFGGRLRAQLGRRSARGLGFSLDFSAGLSPLQEDDAGLDGPLRRADLALYRAKAQGRGQLSTG